MNRPFRSLSLITATIMATSTIPAGAQSQDESAVRGVAMRQADTWNRHDAQSYAALFTEDCDVSRLTITDVQVRFLAPQIALAHARWSMVGAKTPAGIPEPRQGIQTLVLTKQAGEWLIAGFQNTHSVPERPFPMGPGAPEAKP